MPRAASKGTIIIDEDRLIELVKLNPELYDPNHKYAKDANQKKTVWKCIAEELEAPADLCKKVWNKLQDNHLKDNKFKEGQTDRRKSLRSCSSEKNLGFIDASSVENSNENSRASSNCGSPKGDEKRQLRSASRSLSQLTAISETDLVSMASASSTGTITPSKEKLPLSARSGTQSAGRTPKKLNFSSELNVNDTYERYQTISQPIERNLRSRFSEPSHLASKEALQTAVNSTPRRQSGGGRNGRLKKSPNPSDSTRAFFDSMSLTVSTFPQHLQAAMKVHICNIVFETEYDLASPKMR